MWVGTFPNQIPAFGITMEFTNFLDDTPCSFVDTDVSETYILSFFRVVYNEDRVNTFHFLKTDGKRFFKTLLSTKLHGVTHQRISKFTVTSLITSSRMFS